MEAGVLYSNMKDSSSKKSQGIMTLATSHICNWWCDFIMVLGNGTLLWNIGNCVGALMCKRPAINFLYAVFDSFCKLVDLSFYFNLEISESLSGFVFIGCLPGGSP